MAALAISAALTTAPAAAAIDLCAATNSELDLNGDGYDDAAVGDPYASVGGHAQAGAIVILYGDADRRIGEGRRTLLTQASVPGSYAESGDHFGWSVTIADATGDGCADILVGSPDEDWGGRANAGIAHLISFTPDRTGGSGRAHATVLDQGTVGGSIDAGDQFGYAVALGDYAGNEVAAGAIGAPGEDLYGVVDAGVVNEFLYESAPFMVHQSEQGEGLPGTPEAGDRFGAAVQLVPLQVTDGTNNGVELVTLAGAPGDTVVRGDTKINGAGSVTTWDQVAGFEQLVTQDSPDVSGVAEAGDEFGSSIAFGRIGTANPGRDVAIGAPGEDVGTVRDAGSVSIFADVPGTGLVGRSTVTQDTAGFDGTAETSDRFGHSVAIRPEAGASTLIIGVPYEDLGSVTDAGMAQTVRIEPDKEARPVSAYTEKSAGTPGTVARGNRFGLTVAGMRGVAESLFAIVSPYQGAGAVFVANTEGQTRSWVPGRGGVPVPRGSGRFGWAMSGLDGG
ncbi:MAG TPA: VCBS repeat-containing protein [Propionibacteriaceae bacterium]|nr:VCBS repeat-containing protein [Propionibacteriaceae bacterium]